MNNNVIHRKRNKALGVPELIAIALGSMLLGAVLIFYYQITTHVEQMVFIGIIYMLLIFGS